MSKKSLIGNRFLICQALGRGGMSIVRLAFDIEEQRFVAIKCLFQELSEFDDYLLRFIRECQIYRRLRHPHIASYVDSQMSGDPPYVALEYVAGKALNSFIDTNSPLSVLKTLQYFSDAASATHCAHRHGIIHRDIKPSNLIISQDDCLKLIDFGIAHASDGLLKTSTGMMMGTRCYASPEQNQGREVDVESDLYSLAVTFWELLAGLRLFSETTTNSIVEQQLKKSFPPPSVHNKSVPPRLDALIMSMLSPCTEERPSSAKEVNLELLAIKRALLAGRKPSPAELEFECYHVALARYFADDFEGARAMLSSLSEETKNAQIHLLLGKIAFAKKEKLLALRHLKRAIVLEPQNCTIRADYVRTLLSFSMFNQAREAVFEGLSISSHNVLLRSLKRAMEVGRFNLRSAYVLEKHSENAKQAPDTNSVNPSRGYTFFSPFRYMKMKMLPKYRYVKPIVYVGLLLFVSFVLCTFGKIPLWLVTSQSSFAYKEVWRNMELLVFGTYVGLAFIAISFIYMKLWQDVFYHSIAPKCVGQIEELNKCEFSLSSPPLRLIDISQTCRLALLSHPRMKGWTRDDVLAELKNGKLKRYRVATMLLDERRPSLARLENCCPSNEFSPLVENAWYCLNDLLDHPTPFLFKSLWQNNSLEAI